MRPQAQELQEQTVNTIAKYAPEPHTRNGHQLQSTGDPALATKSEIDFDPGFQKPANHFSNQQRKVLGACCICGAPSLRQKADRIDPLPGRIWCHVRRGLVWLGEVTIPGWWLWSKTGCMRQAESVHPPQIWPLSPPSMRPMALHLHDKHNSTPGGRSVRFPPGECG